MKTGVLVMAHGTPSRPEDIEPFYTRIRRGHPPTPQLLDELTQRYAAIGGTSPLTLRTNDQVRGLTLALENSDPGRYDVRYGSKFEPPLLEATAESFRDDRFDRVVGVVLAPHASSLSTDQYMSRAKSVFGDSADFRPVAQWYDAPGFLELVAQFISEALDSVSSDRRDSTEVIFSAHSLPQRVIENGDTYDEQLRDSAAKCASLLGLEHFDVAYQSAGRTPDPWLGPDLLEMIREKASAGFSDIISCPIGFVSDHLEVLYDIDIEAAAVADAAHISLSRTRSLNDDPRFMDVLANVVRNAAA